MNIGRSLKDRDGTQEVFDVATSSPFTGHRNTGLSTRKDQQWFFEVFLQLQRHCRMLSSELPRLSFKIVTQHTNVYTGQVGGRFGGSKCITGPGLNDRAVKPKFG